MIEIKMTENQAKIVSQACEFFARVRMGQFNEIIWPILTAEASSEDFCERRDAAEQYLLKAREQIYPELHGIGHSYGIGKFQDADTAYDVHMALRKLFGDKREPFSLSEEPIPEVKRVEN